MEWPRGVNDGAYGELKPKKGKILFNDSLINSLNSEERRSLGIFSVLKKDLVMLLVPMTLSDNVLITCSKSNLTKFGFIQKD